MLNETNTYRYAREYADPYLGHGIGPVPGYGVSVIFFNIVLIEFRFQLALKEVQSTLLFFKSRSIFFLNFFIKLYWLYFLFSVIYPAGNHVSRRLQSFHAILRTIYASQPNNALELLSMNKMLNNIWTTSKQ